MNRGRILLIEHERSRPASYLRATIPLDNFRCRASELHARHAASSATLIQVSISRHHADAAALARRAWHELCHRSGAFQKGPSPHSPMNLSMVCLAPRG
jgi:hypothetical protein